MQNTTEKETTKAFIKLLQKLTGQTKFDIDKLLPMIEQMELMGILMSDFSSTNNEDELLLIGERIKRCEVESRKVAREFFGHYGIDMEDLKDQFQNPEIIGPKETSFLQEVQEKMVRVDEKLAHQNKHIVSKKKKTGKNKEKGRDRV